MIKFRQFLIEYLNDDQYQKYSKISMTHNARAATDHYFGLGNDLVREELGQADKSETHKKVEQHLGQEISHEEYKSGHVPTPSGGQKKLGGLIKDPALRQEFSTDNTRIGGKVGDAKNFVTVGRGVWVAGQTNPKSNAENPTGHAWKEDSCKNIVNGEHKSVLEKEVKHGTVVVFGHDSDGKEIYRATLQPHHNERGQTAYAINSEAGLKHPEFVAKAHEVASKLSSDYKPGLFKIDPNVYNNINSNFILHPKSTEENISNALKSDNVEERVAATKHPYLTDKNIREGISLDQPPRVRVSTANHPNLKTEHISTVMKDPISFVREAAVRHKNATTDHIKEGLKDPDLTVRVIAASNKNASEENIDDALKDDQKPIVRLNAIKNKRATKKHIELGLQDKDKRVVEAARKRFEANYM